MIEIVLYWFVQPDASILTNLDLEIRLQHPTELVVIFLEDLPMWVEDGDGVLVRDTKAIQSIEILF